MINYKKAGVDIDAGNELVRRIKRFAPLIGGFSDGLPLPKGYREPILVGCTDGVGTKLVLAQLLGIHHTIGYDLVGMNVNDLICTGAKPLFFLDYFACGKLNVDEAEKVVKGISNALRDCDCPLLGGETAEMPGFYKPGEYDLAGFAVGVVDRRKKLNPGKNIRAGDILVGIPSSGLHSNGYSLVRKVFPKNEWRKKAKTLLAPTRLYVREVLNCLKKLNKGNKMEVRGLVHVTGGGFTDNIPRIFPKNLRARIYIGTWKIPPVFWEIQKRAKMPWDEMFRTLNMGVGMIAVLSPRSAGKALHLLKGSRIIGEVEKGPRGVRFVSHGR